tara:strand:+ start:164 stop:571 length:408 start_codon:yes stop_codon:yes gene_type:complete
MARRLILGKKGSDYGLFVSEPGTDVASITNIKDFSFTTSDSGYKGNFLMIKNINENNPASTTVSAEISSDSTSLTSSTGDTLFVATGADAVPLGNSSSGTGAISIAKANTFTNRGTSYLKTSSTFKVTAMGNFFL